MDSLFDMQAIPESITIRLSGSAIEVIFDTKTDPSFEKQFKRLVRSSVRGVSDITTTNRYEENTRFKIAISAYGLTRLADMQAEIRTIAYSHINFVSTIPEQTSLF